MVALNTPDDAEEVDRVFAARTDPHRLALRALIREATAIRDRAGWIPGAASEAMRELAEEAALSGPSPWGSEPVGEAHSTALLFLVTAEDHMKSLDRLVEASDVPTFSHIVVARAALEASALALRLAEPGIGARRRVARVMNERIHSLTEAQRLPVVDPVGRKRRAALFQIGIEMGFRKLNKDRGTWLDEARPGATQSIKWLLGYHSEDRSLGGLIYGYFSAVAHSTLYGLGQSIERHADLPHSATIYSGRLFVTSEGVRQTISAVTLGYAIAAEGARELMGWPATTEYEEAQERAMRFGQEQP